MSPPILVRILAGDLEADISDLDSAMGDIFCALGAAESAAKEPGWLVDHHQYLLAALRKIYACKCTLEGELAHAEAPAESEAT